MDKWRENLDKAFSEAPAAPADEYQRILRRVRSRTQVWPTWLCAASLAFGVLVSVFVKPQTATSTEAATSVSLLSVEVTSPYDESLDVLQDLADQIK